MYLRSLLSLLCFASISVVGVARSAYASPVTINFDSEAANVGAPNVFTNQLNSPLTVGMATFTGGQLLSNEVAGADQSGVYGSVFSTAAAYTNPLKISFASAVSDVSLLITNNLAGNFTVTDNFGNVVTSYLGYNGAQTFSLAGSGITSLQIVQTGTTFWDYAIDDVSFTTGSVAATPEPSSLWLLGTGVVGAAATLRRRLTAA